MVTYARCPVHPGQTFHPTTGACSCGQAHALVDAAPEPAPVTDTERIAYAITRLTRWEDNYRANAATTAARGNHHYATELRIRAGNAQDARKMLDGTDDASIIALRNA